MPISTPQWTEFLTCPICSHDFTDTQRQPISLGCGHTVCKSCLLSLHRTVCPFDQSAINLTVDTLPVNYALLQLVGFVIPTATCPDVPRIKKNEGQYLSAKKCIEELALFLSPLVSKNGAPSEAASNGLTNGTLSRPMHRKLVTLVNCQLAEEEGCARIMRAIRSLGERTVLEFILLHQNSAQLSQNLWTAVRNRGCQFLGPAMQEDALKYILLTLEGGEALSRKVIVLFVVQRLEQSFPHASKTSIGHVVQLLYRASCFKVTKRDDESSLMQLKEQFRTYDALRREHDSQIVQIALEAGLRISPEQWSALLYGDQTHKSHMQSIIDKLQTPESFASSIQELTIALQRSSDPAQLGRLREHFELLSRIDGSPDASTPTWQELEDALKAVTAVVQGLVEFTKINGIRVKANTEQPVHIKFKTSMCRDFAQRGSCPRGQSCTFAHSDDELDKYRRKAKATRPGGNGMVTARGSISDHLGYLSNHADEPENGHSNGRNGSIRTSPLCMQTNGTDYPVSSSYGQLVHRGHNNHSTSDVVVQQLRKLSINNQPHYSGQENGYRNPIVTDCHTPPHNSEQSFSYPWMGRSNGYSSMNGNGHVNGHIDSVVRPGPTRSSPLTVEEEAALNSLNGGINGLNGVNGMNGIMNGHSEYTARRVDEIRRRKSDLLNYPVGQRYRCAQFVQGPPNGYPPFHSSSTQFYPSDVPPRYGPVGTRILPDIERFNGYSPYSQSSLSPRAAAMMDLHADYMHNASFHPHPLSGERVLFGRSPHNPDVIEDSDSGIKTDGETKSLLFEDSLQADDSTYSRPHLSSVSSGVSSGDSFGSHSPRSHSPVGSPGQHSPDAWTGSGETDISSVWSSGDFLGAPFLTMGNEESGLGKVWTPRNSDELSGWSEGLKEKSNESEKDLPIWPRINKNKRSHQMLLDSSSSCSGYWSDPEITRYQHVKDDYQQIKDDEMIARTLQSDEGPPPPPAPSAPPASQVFGDRSEYDEQASDATIALELQNMENDEHGVKIEKERLEFEERKEKEMLKMKQIEDDRMMALRVQNEEENVRYVTDEATIKIHERLYKEHQERAKELNNKENQETKDRRLAEILVCEDAYKHGMLPDREVIKPIKYPVKIVPRGSRVSPTPIDVLESSLP